MTTAIISGTFDPITVGHLSVIKRASKIFDKVVIAMSPSHYKSESLPDEIRLKAINAAIADIKNASASVCPGLLADFCKNYDNPVIVRGARSATDFDYELDMYAINKSISGVESVIFPAEPGMAYVSSSFAREMMKYGKSLDGIVPDGAIKVIEEYSAK